MPKSFLSTNITTKIQILQASPETWQTGHFRLKSYIKSAVWVRACINWSFGSANAPSERAESLSLFSALYSDSAELLADTAGSQQDVAHDLHEQDNNFSLLAGLSVTRVCNLYNEKNHFCFFAYK